jgi:hypothetical protein
MKKLRLILFACLLKSASLFCQSYSTSRFTFCKQTSETITLAELKKCPKLVSKNKKLVVKSFTILITVKLEKDSLERNMPYKEINKDSIDVFPREDEITSLVFEYKIDGNTLTQEAFDFLDKHSKNHQQIFIEDIIATDNGKEDKYTGYTFYLH